MAIIKVQLWDILMQEKIFVQRLKAEWNSRISIHDDIKCAWKVSIK